MKKLMPFKQQIQAILSGVLIAVSLCGVCLPGIAQAEEKTVEIQSGNVLGKIVAEHYPGYANRQAIMQEILQRNPASFSNKNVNSLIVGKTLTLPDAKDIPDLKPPLPKQEGGLDPAIQEKLKSLETQVTELKDTVALQEEENAALQEMVKEYAEKPVTTTTGTDALQKQLDAAKTSTDELQKQLDVAKQSLEESQTAKRTLEEQLANTKRENETLQNDLQQIRAAAAVAENKASGAGNLPWILLGLLALLAVPLIWLLRRKREPSSLVAPSSSITAANVAESPTVAVAGTPSSYSPTDAVATASVVEVEENPDTALKLDIARAYLDLRDSEAAADILQDVLVEGGDKQRQEAREILSFIT